ncbi:aquaglyceroporin related protein [Rhodotorula toruloides]|uniref:Aquaglyceroporin related protein n=1 Tax=Rhodotorula toruloides TaxID=5286 RepID=A0A511KMI3_RHOTO|nr:aquaglyceroporin related protein [Rhodotorula toruloides]
MKRGRARPTNVAGPAPLRRFSTIPDSLFAVSESDRTPGSSTGSSAGSVLGRQLGAGGNDSTSDIPVDEGSVGSSVETGKGKKPLWAVGGVFPKHLSKQRRSSVLPDQKKRRQNSQRPARASSSAAVARDRPAIPRDGTYTTQSSVSSAVVDDEPADVVAHDLDNEKPRERADPFEELSNATSMGSKTAPLEVVVSNDSGRSDEERRRAERGASEEREEQPQQLEKINSGGSRTIAGEVGQGDRDGNSQGEKGSDDEAGQMPGGELDQSEGEWADDFDAREGSNDELPIRNWWGTVRYALREPMAEFLGTMILVCIGIGSTCQTKISDYTMGAYSSVSFAWGFAVMLALYVAGGISGGHCNPAVSVTLAVFRGFPWKMVPRYIVAQVLGAFVGGLIIYGNYRHPIELYDPNKLIHSTPHANASATLFITAPASNVASPADGFCQEILAGGILMIAVLALGDENNAPPGAGLGAIVLGFVVVAIGMSNGWVSGYAINPARDLGPRLALWCVGYGIKLWHHDAWWWLIGPICGATVGSLAGALAYDLCCFTGSGSPINYTGQELADSMRLHTIHNMVWIALSPNKRRARRQAIEANNPEALAESGLAPYAPNVFQPPVRRDHPPGRATEKQREEADFTQRWRRGKEKVWQEEERARQREYELRREFRRSLDESRESDRRKRLEEWRQ